ncbi:hypothetical protein HJB90_08840 [Rhizobium sp. NLR10a]|uniref:pentapeptide repeat-containing protein n=1 Tax=unclassified Rhizobium TaxID=2613769 RepID=UPI001C8357B5|nr:hypothetical protein [Rhizobium sp. NLR9a]MBX5218898.1 hypothetical protein [Rhizobium sp. NLR8a]MBX5275342.1 hypothetical protein [Rhizobium sp. NLR13a]MBX5281129.1 hypothetical protein [Rhizobium sp. NLR10a]MBX5295440.1 hypothetical protein [Rhizobium sp. NLR15a]
MADVLRKWHRRSQPAISTSASFNLAELAEIAAPGDPAFFDGAQFSGANLRGTNLTGFRLQGAATAGAEVPRLADLRQSGDLTLKGTTGESSAI